MRRTLPLFIGLIMCVLNAFSANEVTWNYKIVDDNTSAPKLEITANIASGYHLYSQDNPEAGGRPLVFHFTYQGCKADGKVNANKKYTTEYDDIMLTDVHYYSGKVVFTQKLKATSEKWTVKMQLQGQYCNDSGCHTVDELHTFTGTAPVSKDLKEKMEKDLDKAEEIAEEIAEEGKDIAEDLEEGVKKETTTLLNEAGANADQWWKNVETEVKSFTSDSNNDGNRSLWYIFIAGFLGGLIALVTPCVWPMIPMTVSFFLKSNKSRRKSITAASVYGLSIIIIYVGLGLIVTALFGASALNKMATSAGFNVTFFLLLVIFAFSFMGGFEITLPSKWSNKMDSKADSTTGYISIFFMAFTLCLVSFSCTGPIIGTLLVEAAASSDFVSPAIGMAGFAIALALPFSLFALFPTMLKSIPKSGGWMNTVKVVLGFLELALAFKFLSVADLAYGWRILDREVFIAIWIVIFALLGVYLLGKITLPHDDKVEKIGITRFMLALVSLSFAVYMIPGLWGAPLKSISAFAPPIYTQDFNLYTGDVHAQVNDFEEGMALGRKLNKPVLIDFSGYGCVNCRKMEAAVLTDEKIKSSIENDFVMVTLMVDDKKELPKPIIVKDKDGNERTLYTYGDKWSYLESVKFGANAQPYYVILDGDGKPMNYAFPYEEDIPKFQEFLKIGLENYNKKK